MKQINIFIFFIAFTLLFGGCEDTNENLVGSRGVAVVPILSNLNPAVFDSKDLENTFVEFKLDVEQGASLENAIVKLSINGQQERVDFATFTTFPQTVKIPAKAAAEKLGLTVNDVKLGDIVNVEIWTTSNGKTYQTKTGFNAAVVCAYKSGFVSGSYHAVSKSWGSEGDVTITVDPTDEFIVYVSGLETIEGLVEDKGPLKMKINKLNYAVTVDKAVIASVAWDYNNIAYAGSGTLNTCTGTYEMMFTISVDEGGFGNHAFTLTKNQ